MTGKASDNSSGQILVLLAVWLVASLILSLLALPNLSSPGLYYDEAVNAGLAKDFVTASRQGAHLPGTEVVWLRGRPFPVFVQWYSGAVKPWLIVPSLVFFDATTGVLRATSLFWYLLGMLLCMLWTRRLLGLPAAILVVPILGLDPSFFFPAIVDWGPIIPSFLCRFAGYYLLIRWWHNGKTLDGFLGGVVLGIGFFAKIDFVVILLGCGVALVLSYGREFLLSSAALRKTVPGAVWAFCWARAPWPLKSRQYSMPQREGGRLPAPRNCWRKSMWRWRCTTAPIFFGS